MNGWTASIVFIVFVAAQSVFAIVTYLAARIVLRHQGVDTRDAEVMKGYKEFLESLADLGGYTMASLVLVFLSVHYAKGCLRKRSSTGIGWCLGSRKALLLGFVTGCITAVSYFYFLEAVLSMEGGASPDPALETAVTQGFSFWAWVVIALLLAPLTEEYLFRGFMLGGFTRSMGPVSASIIVTVLFIGMHIFEVIHFLPGFIGISGLAGVTLLFRWKSRALGPAIATHLGYNSIVVSVLIWVV